MEYRMAFVGLEALPRYWSDSCCTLRTLFRVVLSRIWACKLSVASLLIGFVLLSRFQEARDLFNDRTGSAGLFKYVLLLTMVWALQVWQSARFAVSRNPAARFIETLADDGLPPSMKSRWLPRAPAIDGFIPILLGVLPFAIVIWATWLSRLDVLYCEQIADIERLRLCMGYATDSDIGNWEAAIAARDAVPPPAAAYSLSEVSESLARLGRLEGIVGAAAALFFLFMVSADQIAARLRSTAVAKLRLANLTAMAFIFGWAFYWPFELTDWTSRASLIPVLVGSPLPLIDGLSRLSHSLGIRRGIRWAVGITAVVALFIASSYATHYHDMRTLGLTSPTVAQAGGAPRDVPRQAHLDQMIDRWMELNGCADKPEDCRMVLVATEGGASRAAFFTATVLGALLDATRGSEKHVNFAQSVFAISGVSGGAVGAAAFRTALTEAKDGAAPCRHTDPIWFGAGDSLSTGTRRDPTASWRACLQLLASGDYLSPVIVGLSFRDHFALLSPSDRATLLEQGIERHYNAVVHGSRTACGGREDLRGFCRPFGYPRQDERWTPLLLLNATSMDNGRPILVSDLQLAVSPQDRANCPMLSVLGQNLFELYARNPFTPNEPAADQMESCIWPGLEEAADIRFSTAAVLSARFPVVSPAGTLRFKGKATDHVVDGGYFDNSGLETIMRLVPYLRARQIKPKVLYLTNDPWFGKAVMRAGRPFAQSELTPILNSYLEFPPERSYAQMLSWITEPLTTLYSLRSGHKEGALERAYEQLKGSLIAIRVRRAVNVASDARFCGEPPVKDRRSRVALYQPVMSWWLSPFTQRVLDAQLCDHFNIQSLRRVLNHLDRTRPLRLPEQR
ncbi:hypothetical protein ACVWYQ_006560 [Bradyrhizobium sp. USDA 3397]